MIERFRTAVKEKFVDKKPFVIRGHHLNSLAALSANYSDSKVMATKFRIGTEYSPRRFSLMGIPKDLVMAYVKDVLGDSKKSTKEFEKRMGKILKRFLSLPDNHPAEITNEIPDDLCKACIIGKHCTAKDSFGESYLTENFFEDESGFNEFLKATQSLGLPQPEIIDTTAYFSDSGPEKVQKIRTTMGIVRKALTFMNQEYLNKLGISPKS